MTEREFELVRYVGAHEDVPPERLSSHFGVSERTIRTRVRNANEALEGIAHLAKRRGGGYSLVVEDEEGYRAWYERETMPVPSRLPATPEARRNYLLNDLLARSGWITLDDLAAMLYVSRSVISSDIKEVEQALARFDLELEKRPHHGVRVAGTEMNRRLCMANLVLARLDGNESGGQSGLSLSLDLISECVDRVLQEERFQINADAYQNLLVHIAVAVRRILKDCYVPIADEHMERIRGTREFAVAGRIAAEIATAYAIEVPESEVGYIAIHLAGKQTLYGVPTEEDEEYGLVISDEVWSVVSDMLEVVWDAFHFDFRNDLELRMNLARHIVPLSVRLRYNMRVENPMLSDIRERFPLAYAMALDASAVLVERYGSRLSADETGYIALAFALALERQKSDLPRKNILVVCASGEGSARLLEYRYRQEFGAYVGSVTTCNVMQIDEIDFEDIDYVFTTVPLNRTLPVPVREVRYFLEEGDARAVRELLSSEGSTDDITRYFDPQLFLPHLELRSKGEVLDLLCACMAASHELPDDFRLLVEQRELAAQTCFGNLVAIPHPMRAVSDGTFVCVGLLEHPIARDEQQQVQVVLLISISKARDKNLSRFYQGLVKLIGSEEAVRELLEDQTFSKLVSLLEQCG